MRARAASTRPESRESSTTRAPCSTKSLAMASPIPIEAPVITATLPDNEAAAEFKSAMRVCNLTCLSSQGGVQSSASQHGECRVHILLMSALLPLFPLDLVLLPAVPLSLHIFEPRYKEMITECLTQKSHSESSAVRKRRWRQSAVRRKSST